MISKNRAMVGIQAGLLAGASIVVLFFLLDLVRLRPLATPLAFGSHLFGPNGPFLDTPVLSQLVAITLFAGNLFTLTILRFLTFSFLGVSAVWWCEQCGFSLNIATGAIFWILVGSFVFYTCLALGSDHVIANFPGPWSVAVANLTAGAVMGGFVRFSQSRSS